MPPFPAVTPPLFNSASLWATTFQDLTALYTCPHTGAITTRTAYGAKKGFSHNETIHQHAFTSFSHSLIPKPAAASGQTTHPEESDRSLAGVSTLNTLGYSPLSLAEYVDMVQRIELLHRDVVKPVIFSVAGGSAAVLLDCFALLAARHHPDRDWCMEVNLSCPNIAGAPPPAYNKGQLTDLIRELKDGIATLVLDKKAELERMGAEPEQVEKYLKGFRIPIGLKLPPYTYAGQFDDVVEVIGRFNAEDPIVPSRVARKAGSESLTVRMVKLNGAPGEQTSIDPTLLNKQQTDSYVQELSNGIENSLSLSAALGRASAATSSNAAVTGQNASPLSSSSSSEEEATTGPRPPTNVAASTSSPPSASSLTSSPSSLPSHLIAELFSAPFPISFVSSTNTLGSSLLMSEYGWCDSSATEPHWKSELRSADGSGLGGLAGAALHPLALGNVRSLRGRLREGAVPGPRGAATAAVKIVGIGGVADHDSFRRMRCAGADCVALATALGLRGTAVFGDILNKKRSED